MRQADPSGDQRTNRTYPGRTLANLREFRMCGDLNGPQQSASRCSRGVSIGGGWIGAAPG